MAEIAIRAVNNTWSPHRLRWLRGMPVVVMPDGHPWSDREKLPPAQGGKHVIVKVTDVTVEQVSTFFRNRWGFDLCSHGEPDVIFNVAQRRRAINVLVDNLPPAVLIELRDTGMFTTTWAQIRTFIQRHETQELA